jgi:hypothetical protein
VITALPLHAAAGEAISAVEGESVTLDGSGSSPASEITKYRWQFGDGAEEEGAGDSVLHHAYATAGQYTAKLTVFRGSEHSNEALVSVTVTAKPQPAGGGHPAEGVYVTVKNTSAAPVGGATVLYVGAGGTRIEATSDSSGEAVLTGMPEGTDTVYVYKSGLRPCGVPKLDRALERGGLPLSRGRSLPAPLGTADCTQASVSSGFSRLGNSPPAPPIE